MKLIARSKIVGINSDIGLKALDGYVEFSADVSSQEELYKLFKEKYPDFRDDEIEIIQLISE